MDLIIGVDIGGTFTEAVAVDNTGDVYYSKTPTTYDDLSHCVLNALSELASSRGVGIEVLLSNTRKFAHGTTHTVNAMIQRKGAKTGLITTKGFRDHFIVMNAGRGAGVPETERMRFSRIAKPEPLVPYSLTEEVTERVDYAGRILVPVNEEEVKIAINRLQEKGVRSIAISTLWSFKNSSNELKIKRLVTEAAPDLFCTSSSELSPVMGEYQRTATVVLNSYLGPILKSYCYSLHKQLEEKGLKHPLLLMQSMGGLIPATEAPAKAVTTLMSGLAGGVIASHYIGSLIGYRNIITTDMGGTSFEVGIIYDGKPVQALHPLAPRSGPYISRYTIHVPMIDITAIGAGGGSIAWVDKSVIRVGPLSAGAKPGPACYEGGGNDPTVTDADLILGLLNPNNFLGGKMKLSLERSRNAIHNKITSTLGIDVIDAAKGIQEVVNNQMADLLRKTTIERGHDPRDFVIFGFGGAGPVHCASYGMELGASKIMIPGRGFATAHSAFGVAIADLKQSYALTDPMTAPIDLDHANENFDRLEKEATRELRSWGVEHRDLILTRSLDMRFRRQVHEVNVPIMSSNLMHQDVEEIYRRFEHEYELLYGRGAAFTEAGIEIVTFRIEAIGIVTKSKLKKYELEGPDPSQALLPKRQAFFKKTNDFVATSVYDGLKLKAGNLISGSAIIEYPGTTVVINPEQEATIDEYLNVIIEV